MSSERSPVTHPSNYDTQSFWRHMDKDKKKEFLHIDTLYNRQFLEKTRALLLGGVTGLTFGILFFRIKNRFVLTSLTSGLSCAVFCHIRSAPVHSQYFKVWDHIKNDKEAFETISKSSGDMSNDDFAYFYRRYLRFFYPHMGAASEGEAECKSCTK